MVDATLRIKNLSIALEALSRINSYGASTSFYDVEKLLKVEIAELKKENERPIPSARPATTTPDDDIPF